MTSDPEVLLPADPGAGYRAHEEEIRRALARALAGNHYILGPEVAAFEQELATYLGAGHAVGVASGTDALRLALTACGLRPGHAVITVSHTAVATIAAIETAGAVPILVDVDPVTQTLDPGRLEDALTEGRGSSGETPVKALLPVHLYGHPADLPTILDIASRHGLRVIEDCAQSHGAEIGGVRTGRLGTAGGFSFYPTKNLPAFGDAGAVVTGDPEVAALVRMLREYGWTERYVSQIPGTNSRLDELQAAVLRVRLKFLDAENQRRRAIAAHYSSMLRNLPLVLPVERPNARHVYHQYVIQTESRDPLREYLNFKGIRTLIHYPVPVHLQPAYRGRVRIHRGGLAETERLASRILSLPMHPFLTNAQVERVVEAVTQFFEGRVTRT
ncbi:MAG: DegT/DnrJ/EryC1/StrS family aminotransferase [Acidobacteriota bacterium]